MRRILVTGGAGFIGGHFVRRWRAAHPGDRVVVLDALTYAASRRNLGEGTVLVQGDVADARDVAAAFGALGGECAVVAHFAAETHVDRSIADAAPFWRTNVLGTQRLLDAARLRGVGRFLHVSTDEVYGPTAAPVAEAHPLAPSSPYAASKAAADALVGAAVAAWAVPAIITRSTNNFGEAQYPEKLLPVLIRAALAGAPLPLYGDGLHERDWLDVGDHCDALALILDRGEVGTIYNIAAGDLRRNADTAAMVCAAAGASEASMVAVPDRPGHDRRYAIDASRLAALGWRPRRRLSDRISELVSWYRENPSWWR